MTTVRLTPTDRKILEILKDRQPHLKEELMPCLADFSNNQTLYDAIHRMNKRLEKFGKGHIVISQYKHRRYWYRLGVFKPEE